VRESQIIGTLEALGNQNLLLQVKDRDGVAIEGGGVVVFRGLELVVDLGHSGSALWTGGKKCLLINSGAMGMKEAGGGRAREGREGKRVKKSGGVQSKRMNGMKRCMDQRIACVWLRC